MTSYRYVLVLVRVDQEALDNLGTDFMSEMGWVAPSGITPSQATDITESTTVRVIRDSDGVRFEAIDQ